MGNTDSRNHWKDINHCAKCRIEIGVLTRHHCRNCGNSFCNPCSSYLYVVSQYYKDKFERRVCRSCFEFLRRCKFVEDSPVLTKKSISDMKIGINNFDLLTIIGTGKYGKVVKVREKSSGKIYAMKVLDKKIIRDGGEVQHTIAERNILMRVRHPFLMRLHYAFQTTDKLALVMDFINGGELFYHLQKQPSRKFDNDRACFYAAEIALGIEHLHQMGIIYRDIKPENVLIDAEGHIRMTDFGLSKEGLFKTNDRTSTFCGTPEYLAPEVLEGGDYNNAVDWWGFGALIYEMLTGWAPFYTKDVQKMYKLKITARVGVPDYVNPQAKHLLLRLLDRNPDTRISDPDKIKAHPWFSKIDWQKLFQKEIQPPYKPTVSSVECTTMIADDFTKLCVQTTLGNTEGETIDDDPAFPDYTFYEQHEDSSGGGGISEIFSKNSDLTDPCDTDPFQNSLRSAVELNNLEGAF